MNTDGILIQDTIGLLDQAETLIEQLSDEIYTDTSVPPFKSSIGMHLRHILDFYNAFFARQAGRIDYDRRQRAPEIETGRQAAVDAIQRTRLALTDIPNFQTAVTCKNDDGSGDPETAFHQSSIGRELQFLASHTVHHYAMIAMLLTRYGITPPDDFGVAPSTLAYWRSSGVRG